MQVYLRQQWLRRVFAQYYRCWTESAQSTAQHVEYPLEFRVQNAAALLGSHYGMLELVAEEGFVHMPVQTMARIKLPKDEFALLTSSSLPKAASVKLRLHTMDSKHDIHSHFNVQILVVAKHSFLHLNFHSTK
ncbi:ubiquitin fusion degradation protein 1 [Hordeum vulgare]|nr:ubiquitin fusion degradation protein 1 [Hordeum vulgare]KAI4997809.1 hypothetical protein ZWY2020_053151 [Hordeum vulgare]